MGFRSAASVHGRSLPSRSGHDNQMGTKRVPVLQCRGQRVVSRRDGQATVARPPRGWEAKALYAE